MKSIVEWIEEAQESGFAEHIAHEGWTHGQILNAYLGEAIGEAPIEERARIRAARNALFPDIAADFARTMQAEPGTLAGRVRAMYERENAAAAQAAAVEAPAPLVSS